MKDIALKAKYWSSIRYASRANSFGSQFFIHCLLTLVLLGFSNLSNAAYWMDPYQYSYRAQWASPEDICSHYWNAEANEYLYWEWDSSTEAEFDAHCVYRVIETGEVFDTRNFNFSAGECPEGYILDLVVGTCRPDYDSGPPSCASSVGNPINAITGAKFQEEVDYSDPLGTLTFRRYFDTSSADGLWNFRFSQTIATRSYTNKTSAMTHRADGSVIRFWGSAASGWVADAGKQQHELESSVQEGTAIITGWTLSLDGQELIETYDEDGQLLSIADRNGTTHTLAYEFVSGGFTRVTITDRHERELVLLLNSFTDQVVTATTPDGSIEYAYDTENRLTGVEFSDGTTRTYHYEDSQFPSYLTGVSIGDDRFATWEYDSEGRAVVSYHGDGIDRVVLDYTFLEDDTNPRITVTNALNKQTTYHYEEVAGQRVVTRVEGIATSQCAASNSHYSYDANGYQLTHTNERGFVTETIRDSSGRTTLETSAMQWTDGVGSSLLPTDDSLRISTTWLDDRTLVDFRSYESRQQDGSWLLYKEEDFEWDEQNRLVSQTISDPQTSESRTTENAYLYHDADKNQLKYHFIFGPSSDPFDYTFQSYDILGRVLASGENVRAQSGDFIAHVVNYQAYNEADLPVEVVDENGVTTRLAYDAKNRITTSTIVHPSGDSSLELTTVFEYSDDNLTQITLPDGSFTKYEYDIAQRLEAIENNLGERREYTLDDAGNVTTEKLVSSDGTISFSLNRTYDELSRLRHILQNDGQDSELHYDVGNNNTASINPNLASTKNAFDGLNRLATVLDDYENPTTYEYDTESNVTEVKDARGLSTTYQYNGFGDLVEQLSPDTGLTKFTHDESGNVLTMIDAQGIEVTYSYDTMGRLLTKSYPGSPEENVTYYYDEYSMDEDPHADAANSYPIGRLTGIDGPNSRQRFFYDYLGNITHELDTTIVDGVSTTASTRYTYDENNQVVGITYPTGLEVTYHTNVIGQIERVTALYQGKGDSAPVEYVIADNIQYEPFGPMKGLTFGNGVALTRNFDTDYNLGSASLEGNSGEVMSVEYDYDANGNLVEEDLQDIEYNREFSYDPLDRVTEAFIGSVFHDYEYDSVGNRLSHEEDGWLHEQTYAEDSNRLSETGFYLFNGNPTLQLRSVVDDDSIYEPLLIYTFNDAGGLAYARYWKNYLNSSVREYDNKGYYHYNPQGQRVHKSATIEKRSESDVVLGTEAYEHYFYYGQDGEYLVDQQDFVLTLNETTSYSLPSTRQWIYLNGIPIAQITESLGIVTGAYLPSRITYYYNDHLGVPRLGMNQDQEVIWRATPTAFGKDFHVESVYEDGFSVDNSLRFPGQFYDKETGLHYNWNRYYDPSSGRYIQSDPLGLFDGPNTYAYVHNNPVNNYDLTGEASYVGAGAAVAGIIWRVYKSLPIYMYELRDCKGELVYVGISKFPQIRYKQHVNRSRGKIRKHGCQDECEVKMFVVSGFKSENAARVAEKRRIKRSRPIWNDQHNPDSVSKRDSKREKWKEKNCDCEN